MSWFYVGATVVATALTYTQQRSVAKKQDKINTQAILAQQKNREQSADALKATTDQLKQSNAGAATAQAKTQYLSDLSSGKPLSTQPATTGALSDAYRQAAGAANDAESTRAANDAGLMAITDSAGLQRQAEGNTVGRLGINLSGIGMQGRDINAQNQLKLQGVSANPWVSLLASGLSSYGSAGLAGRGAQVTPQSTGTNALGGNAGNVLAGDTYTGPGSTSSDYTSNIKRLYGNI